MAARSATRPNLALKLKPLPRNLEVMRNLMVMKELAAVSVLNSCGLVQGVVYI